MHVLAVVAKSIAAVLEPVTRIARRMAQNTAKGARMEFV
jgi:hypothetical protein